MRPQAQPIKLIAPARPPGYAPTRLADRVAHSHVRLLTIHGPAGTGKSMLALDWYLGQPSTARVWITLDDRDHDTAGLWNTLTIAMGLRAAGPDDALGLRGLDEAALAAATAAAVNAIAARRHLVAIVLDDCHRAGPALSSLQSFVELLPPGSQVVMVGRQQPPLRLGRLRMAGYLEEIGPDDLKLDEQDTSMVLAAAGIDVTTTDAAEVTRRTQGWLAAIQLVIAQLDRSAGADDLERVLDVTPTTIGDAQVELFDDLGIELRGFLRELAILDEFTPADCAAVTGRANVDELLQRALGHAMFLTRHGNDETFRMQQLVRDVLRAELDTTAAPGEIAALHRRAAAWFKTNAANGQAAHHLRAAGDHADALALVRESLPGAYYDGGPAAVRALLAEIDLRAAAADATGESQCSLAVGLGLIGMTELSREWLDKLALAVERPPPVIAVTVAMTRCATHLIEGETDEAARHWMTATELAAEAGLDTVAGLGTMQVLTMLKIHLWNGDFEAADAVYEQHRRRTPLEVQSSNRLASGAYAEVLAVAGRLGDAERLAERTLVALEAADRGAQSDHHDTLRAIALVRYERGDLDQAWDTYEVAFGLTETSRRACAVQALLGMARVELARGRTAEAAELTARARRLLGESSTSPLLDVVYGADVRVAMATGDIDTARSIAASIRGHQRRLLLTARVEILAGRPTGARAALRAVREPVTRRARIDLLVARARLEQLAGEVHDAGATLAEALELAFHVGMVRPFVEDGPELRTLLNTATRGLPSGDFVDALRDAVDRALSIPLADPRAHFPGWVRTKLGTRELHVLELLSRRLPLGDIAAQLYISRNTLKTHLRSIYRKLGVHSREEAIVVATARGMVPSTEPTA